jgi:hypothetical protein
MPSNRGRFGAKLRVGHCDPRVVVANAGELLKREVEIRRATQSDQGRGRLCGEAAGLEELGNFSIVIC